MDILMITDNHWQKHILGNQHVNSLRKIELQLNRFDDVRGALTHRKTDWVQYGWVMLMLSTYFATSASSFPCQWVLPWEAKAFANVPLHRTPNCNSVLTNARCFGDLRIHHTSPSVPIDPLQIDVHHACAQLSGLAYAGNCALSIYTYLYACSAGFGISLWSHLINLTSFASFFSLSCESAASATELCGQQQTRNKFLFKRGLDLLNHVIIACVQLKCIKHCQVALRSQSNWTVSPLDTELGLAWRWEKLPSQILLVACSGLKKYCLAIFSRLHPPRSFGPLLSAPWHPHHLDLLDKQWSPASLHGGVQYEWLYWNMLNISEYHPPKKTGASDAFQNKLCKFYLVLSFIHFTLPASQK